MATDRRDHRKPPGCAGREMESSLIALRNTGRMGMPTVMPRRSRIASGGYVYHALNRAAGRSMTLEKVEDYAASETLSRSGFIKRVGDNRLERRFRRT